MQALTFKRNFVSCTIARRHINTAAKLARFKKFPLSPTTVSRINALSTNGSKRLLILAGLFTALTITGARLKIPLPFVSFTMQDFFVLASGLILGPFYGAGSQLAYLFLGLMGLPIFSEGGGPAYIFKPTFGYLLGFPLASFTAGMIVHRGVKVPASMPPASLPQLILANTAALLVIFIPGVLYLWWNLNFVLGQALSLARAAQIGFLVFLPGDVIKIIGVILLYRALQPRLTATFRLSTNTPVSKTAAPTSAETAPPSG